MGYLAYWLWYLPGIVAAFARADDRGTMANTEHVALLHRGVSELNAVVRDNHDLVLDLEGADLHGLDLREAMLFNAKLAGADLAGADLRGARLPSADLQRVNLRGADLRGASMHRANLSGADLRGAKTETFSPGQVCLAPPFFEGVHWDKEALERIMGIINLNPDWEIRYEIVGKNGKA